MRAQRPQAYAHSCTFMFVFLCFMKLTGCKPNSSRSEFFTFLFSFSLTSRIHLIILISARFKLCFFRISHITIHQRFIIAKICNQFHVLLIHKWHIYRVSLFCTSIYYYFGPK